MIQDVTDRILAVTLPIAAVLILVAAIFGAVRCGEANNRCVVDCAATCNGDAGCIMACREGCTR